MSWSWSHTAEAYENARENLGRMAYQTLQIIWAEWEAFEPSRDEPGRQFDSSSSSQLNEAKYKAALETAKTLPKDVLAEAIWDKASELATCTNGGWEAWLCPFGCGCHMVSFSNWAEQMRERKEALRKMRLRKALESGPLSLN